ncbi:MAG TPA: hypothetical protein VGZ93_03450 [Candidatus Methylacidiphilales bacterium]|jgi:exonuclease VII large subunit|nr:hypothetical protein [Candidatus Methylacidiphilales bacterium]
MRPALFFALLFMGRLSFAQTNAPPPAPATKPASPTKMSRSQMTAVELQKMVDQLTKSNADLVKSNADMLELLKKQQAVLEDMQFDHRLESRQIESLEERLENTLLENAQLQKKIATLEANGVPRPQAGAVTETPSPATSGAPNTPPVQPAPAEAAETPPPSTYLPPAPEGAPGIPSWHRLFTLKGDDNKQSDLFRIQGRTWRVFWHNQDKPEKVYQNTSALFINAFPKDDTIPEKVCSKLGTGSDSIELEGPGNYYLKVEASGGSWELAVEDFY